MQENIANKTNIIKKVGIIGLIFNIILLIIKFLVGIIFNSYALIADAINSFGDCFSSIITYIGAKISSKPSDNCHQFGHQKAEYIAIFLIGIFMIIAGFNMGYKSIIGIFNKSEFVWSVLVLIVPIITIVIKTLLYFYTIHVGKRLNSILVLSNSKDHRNDIMVAIGVLIGIIFGMYGYFIIDSIIATIISFVIIISGIKITYDGYNVLIDKSINIEMTEELRNQILDFEGVLKINSIKSKPTGDRYIIILEITVDKDMTVKTSHEIANNIQETLANNENIYDTIVHINPSINENTNEIQ